MLIFNSFLVLPEHLVILLEIEFNEVIAYKLCLFFEISTVASKDISLA